MTTKDWANTTVQDVEKGWLAGEAVPDFGLYIDDARDGTPVRACAVGGVALNVGAGGVADLFDELPDGSVTANQDRLFAWLNERGYPTPYLRGLSDGWEEDRGGQLYSGWDRYQYLKGAGLGARLRRRHPEVA